MIAIVIIGLHLFLDNQEVALDVNGEAAVAPGTYAFSIRDNANVELASGDITVAPCTQAEPTPTPTPTPEGTPTPTPTPTPGTTPTPTPTPEDSVGGDTATPTLPPTDTVAGTTSSPTSDGWRVMLVVLAEILATVLVLTPKRDRRPR